MRLINPAENKPQGAPSRQSLTCAAQHMMPALEISYPKESSAGAMADAEHVPTIPRKNVLLSSCPIPSAMRLGLGWDGAALDGVGIKGLYRTGQTRSIVHMRRIVHDVGQHLETFVMKGSAC